MDKKYECENIKLIYFVQSSFISFLMLKNNFKKENLIIYEDKKKL